MPRKMNRKPLSASAAANFGPDEMPTWARKLCNFARAEMILAEHEDWCAGQAPYDRGQPRIETSAPPWPAAGMRTVPSSS